jgi:DNA replication and repair protein RecF
MQLLRLTCAGFRCLADLDYRPAPGINVIQGDNAQGKTSLLEAVLFLTTSKSHRTTQESELVRQGEEAFRLHGEARRAQGEVVLDANWWRGAKRFRVNGVAQTRVSDILGKVNVVFFSPEDVDIVRGSATVRRRFLDMELSQLQPRYLRALQQYRQVLRQRNELVRKPRLDATLLDVWDEQLAREGEVLRSERGRFVESLTTLAAEAYQAVAPGEPLTVAYDPNVRGPLDEALAASRDADRRNGLTTRGPHRDDLAIRIAGRPARQYGSQGQQRTAALALKLAELELIRREAGEYPILMLDDVLSELDENRSRRLFEALNPDVQCLITTTELTVREGLFGAGSARVQLREGRLETP